MTLTVWWCGSCNTRNEPWWSVCCKCGHPRKEKHAQVHTSERAVIYRHPLTGQHITPARADMPMPEVYAKQGFQREEIMHMGSYERATGVIHEASNYSAGNEALPIEPPPPGPSKEVKEELINDVRAAIASGPWTSEV